MRIEKKNSKIYGEWLTRRLMDIYYFEIDTVDEFQLSENMDDMFFKFGDCVSGDEKLFRYTGSSGFLRLVKNKPARLGLWMFQAAIRLKCGLPCLIYTRIHCSCMNRNTPTRCHDIVSDWGNLIKERGQNRETILVMDNYYLTEETRE